MQDRVDGRDYTRSALFVDFDNIYTSIKRRDPEAARRFATHPRLWVAWFEETLGPVGPRATNETRRVVLQRNCYLNPTAFGSYRGHFTRAGFRVVDCPPLTQQGKNSADIHIVLDALDVLAHPTYYDEIIVLSLDADFTPLFLRLRAFDRRVVMLGSGPAAGAMRSACDYVIPDEIFFDEALVPPDEPADGAAPLAERAGDVAVPAAAPPAGSSGAPEPASDELREQVRLRVAELVAATAAPVSGAALGARLTTEFGSRLRETKWLGFGTFKALVTTLESPTLTWNPVQTGYVGDPTRHIFPAPDVDGWTGGDGGRVRVVEEVSRVIDLPRLSREHWRRVLVAVADALSPAEQGLAARERAAVEAAGAVASTVRYVVEGLRVGGYDLDSPPHVPEGVAAAFAASVVRLAQAAQVALEPDDERVLMEWVSGGLAPGTA